MAQYRFSSQIVSRSTGRSAVAAAAYRSGQSLADERTGLVHDFSQKRGIAFAEIMAPDNAPDWMLDRSRLWNAVEAAEKRKDAQLSREVQLSLPHELTEAHRIELVRGFVNSQFVARGMIADVAIHRPSDRSDERNHHAHVMLTMRELTGEGFGNKAREWNDADLLQTWREEWANHQNRMLEREGYAGRVDHRSFAAQGVDREPTQHLGPNAHQMEQRGKASRIGDENRATDERNTQRAEQHQAAVVVNLDLERHRRQSAATTAARLQVVADAQQLSFIDLERKHDRQTFALKADQEQRFGQSSRTIAAELAAIAARSETTGWRRIVRKVIGSDARDASAAENLRKTAASIEQRKAEQLTALKMDQQAERQKLVDTHEKQRAAIAIELAKANAKREREILAVQRKAQWEAQRAATKQYRAEQAQRPAYRRNEPLTPEQVQKRIERKERITAQKAAARTTAENPAMKREFDKARGVEQKAPAAMPTEARFMARPTPAPAPIGELPRAPVKQVQQVPQQPAAPTPKPAPAPRKDWRVKAPVQPVQAAQTQTAPQRKDWSQKAPTPAQATTAQPKRDFSKLATPAPSQTPATAKPAETPARKDWSAAVQPSKTREIKPLPQRDRSRDRDRER